jgi:hypothetical protein
MKTTPILRRRRSLIMVAAILLGLPQAEAEG